MNRHILLRVILYTMAITIIAVFVAITIKGCGIEPSTRIVEVENPGDDDDDGPEFTCDGFNPGSIRKRDCRETLGSAYIGDVLDFCGENGEWKQISSDCKKECGDDELLIDKGLVTFEKDIKKILLDHCVKCHATYANYEVAKIKADESYRLTSLPESANDCMPAGDCGSVSREEIDQLKQWIQNGKPKEGNCATEQTFIDLDRQESAILSYLASIDEQDRAFMRFFTYAHRYNVGEKIAEHAKGLGIALNSLSFDTQVFNCSPLIEAQKAICAFDIRSIQRTPFDFARIEAFDRIGFVSNTTQGQLIRQLTRTDQPVFHFDVFIDTVFTNNQLYSQLMNIPNTRDEFLAQNGVLIDVDITNAEYSAIGTNSSEISAQRNTRLMVRFDGEREGVEIPCWLTYDNGPSSENDPLRDVFQNPFLEGSGSEKVFVFDAQELICTLPNKASLLFFLADAAGAQVDFAPTDIVGCNRENCLDFQIDTPIDCLNCHSGGYIPEIDVVGNHIKASGVFDAVDREIALRVFKNEARNQALFNADNLQLQEGQRKLGRTIGEPSQLSIAHNQYQANQSAAQVAAFFHRAEQELIGCIQASSILRVTLSPLLSNGKINHDTLVQNFGVIASECRFLEDPILPN